MKAQLYDSKGAKKSEISLPVIFDTKVRQDIAQKAFHSFRFMAMQPYSHDPRAGRKHSASGTISHQRHQWKGHYGKGIARIPRKTMYRTGTQFVWVGAEVTSARGGRRVHGPMLIKRPKKVNKQEFILALNSCLASSFAPEFVSKRYSSLQNNKVSSAVIESKLENVKSKDLLAAISKIFAFDVFQNKETRAGKGKIRGRKYKSSAGLLLIKSDEEKIKSKGINIVSVSDLSIMDVYPLGRLILYTEKALKQIESLGKTSAVAKEAKK